MSSTHIYSLYLITNLINNKKYIGITKNVDGRWKRHRAGVLPESKGYSNGALHYAITKHGVDNFKFEVLYQSKSQDHILDTEVKFISELETVRTGYNRHPGGRTRLWTAEEKITLSKNRIGENNPNWQSGKGAPKGHRAGISRPGQDIVMKIQPRLNGKIAPHPPIEINGIRYDSLKDAMSQTKLTYYHIHSRIKQGIYKIVI